MVYDGRSQQCRYARQVWRNLVTKLACTVQHKSFCRTRQPADWMNMTEYIDAYIEGSGPVRYISSMLYSQDTPFLSGTLDMLSYGLIKKKNNKALKSIVTSSQKYTKASLNSNMQITAQWSIGHGTDKQTEKEAAEVIKTQQKMHLIFLKSKIFLFYFCLLLLFLLTHVLVWFSTWSYREFSFTDLLKC